MMSSNVDKNKPIHKEKPASRVTILDAVDLDFEIQRILRDQLAKVFQSFSPSFNRWEPELDTLLRLAVWKLSVWQFKSTFGQQLLSVKYGRNFSSNRAAIWAFLTIGCRYLKIRSPEIASFIGQSFTKDKVKEAMSVLELGVEVVCLLNLLVFLREGEFPTLADRLTGLRPVSATSASRTIGYTYMTRELLWHGFIELIVFILPLVNYKYLLRCGRKFFGLQRTKSGGKKEALVYTTATRCAVCDETPVLPHHMGCQHSFCYYCLMSNRMADSKFECPSCGHFTEEREDVQPVSARLSISS